MPFSFAYEQEVLGTLPRVELDTATLLRILPQRPPFLLVDRVTALEPGKRIEGIRSVSASEPWFAGHFPMQPILPNGIAVESLAQLCAVLIYTSTPESGTQRIAYFLGIDQAKFRRPIFPGDTMKLSARLVSKRTNISKCECEILIGDSVAVQASLLISLSDRDELPGQF